MPFLFYFRSLEGVGWISGKRSITTRLTTRQTILYLGVARLLLTVSISRYSLKNSEKYDMLIKIVAFR